MATTKDSRIAVRHSSEQDALIRHASEVEGTTVTAFTVSATVAHAREVLADRKVFALSADRWDSFVEALDRPVRQKPSLERLLGSPSIFDDA